MGRVECPLLYRAVCPHCQAVNDVASGICSVCGTDLTHPAPAIVPRAASAPAKAVVRAAWPPTSYELRFDPDRTVGERYSLEVVRHVEGNGAEAPGGAEHGAAPRAVPRRPTWRGQRLGLSVALGALVVLAGSTYYVWRQHVSAQQLRVLADVWRQQTVRDPGAAATAHTPAAFIPSTLAAGANALPVAESRPEPTVAERGDVGNLAPLSAEKKTERTRELPAAVEAAAVVVVTRRRPRDSAAPSVYRPPSIGPCTEAVAALGLCTPDSAQRRP